MRNIQIDFSADITISSDEELSKIIKKNVKDPRNITSEEWNIANIVYELVDQERWENIIKIACANNENIENGGGENKRNADNFRRKIGK